jgi:hypothetical protein
MPFCSAIEIADQSIQDSAVRLGIGTPRSLRRHRATLKLPNHFFPDLAVRREVSGVDAVENQFARFGAGVVACDAVLLDDFANLDRPCRRCGSDLRRSRRDESGCRRRDPSRDDDRTPDAQRHGRMRLTSGGGL